MSARSLVSDIYGLGAVHSRRVQGAPQKQVPVDLESVPPEILGAAMQRYIVAAAEGEAAPFVSDATEVTAAGDAERLSALCIGCIGGVAIDTLAPHKTQSLALIGTGNQARAQLAAAVRLRRFTDIRIYGRRPVAAAELAKAYAKKLGFQLTVSPSPEAAVHGADIVILATNSPEPVIDADWVAPQAHVTTVGPRGKLRREMPLGLIQRARTIVSDDPDAIRENPEHFLHDNPAMKRLTHLGRLVGRFNPDRNRGMTLFLTEGLPGAEAALHAAAARYAHGGRDA